MNSILSKVSYFSHLPQEDILAIQKNALKRNFQTEQIVVMEGENNGGLYIIESGWLKVSKMSMSGREQVLNFLGPGDVFNAIAVFTDHPNQASVIALEDSTVWWIDQNTITKLIQTHPALAKQVIADLASRILHLIGLVEDLSLRTIESRLARVLLQSMENSQVTRQKWATQNEMAARLGTVPDVLNRALRKFVDEGIIDLKRHQIRILDIDALKLKID
ncbi:MAG: Crp/Fnr family transcriptional regulator [Anaerolineaceae bacterium]|jgi:CRP/FNR family transcriptional regulator|nr:Crp/Fnr family transcriptional regulator [Anaerolineaceae bacterium]